MTSNEAGLKKQELAIIYLIAAVQFVNIVDFMMVMPLGPDFAKALGIGISHLGIIAGTYTFAAAVAGLICSSFVDKFDRKHALIFAVIGLSVGTIGAAVSWNLTSLLWARALAGAFGGPATAIGLAIIADVVPPEKRGRAMGTVMMAFSLASTFGVPVGLELARMGTWHTPFVVVGLCGIIATVLIYKKMPSMTAHLGTFQERTLWTKVRGLLTRSDVLISYGMTCFLMMSGFVIFPNLAAYVQLNLHVPREDLSSLYLIGGFVTLGSMPITGRLIDKYGSLPWFVLGTFGFSAALYFGFLVAVPVSAWLIFALFMFFGTFRNMSANTLSSKVPEPQDRAGFMSIQSAVQHLATALGGYLSTLILFEEPSGALGGTHLVAYWSMAFAVVALFAMILLHRKVPEFKKVKSIEPLPEAL